MDDSIDLGFATYGTLTAHRILTHFNIQLDDKTLFQAIKNPNSMFYQLLRVPFKNIYNGIILQQANDFQVYAKKLFVDYLLSGESGKDSSSPGETVRDELEDTRKNLVQTGEAFHEQELVHQKLIATSQAKLIKLSADLEDVIHHMKNKIYALIKQQSLDFSEARIVKAIHMIVAIDDTPEGQNFTVSNKSFELIEKDMSPPFPADIKSQIALILAPLNTNRLNIWEAAAQSSRQAEEIYRSMCSFRSLFSESIKRTIELIHQLPDYQLDEFLDKENRASLFFDPDIGEKNK